MIYFSLRYCVMNSHGFTINLRVTWSPCGSLRRAHEFVCVYKTLTSSNIDERGNSNKKRSLQITVQDNRPSAAFMAIRLASMSAASSTKLSSVASSTSSSPVWKLKGKRFCSLCNRRYWDAHARIRAPSLSTRHAKDGKKIDFLTSSR